MGNEWACPCAERVRVSRRLQNSTEPDIKDRHSQLHIKVKSVIPAKIPRKINRPQAKHMISSFTKHPRQDMCLIISLLEPYLKYKLVTNGSYQIVSHQFTTISLLESEIQQKNEKGFVFIGGYCDLNKFYLVYYQSYQQSEGRIMVKVATRYNLQELTEIFRREANSIFIGCIHYQTSSYLFFMQIAQPAPVVYFIAEFPTYGMDDPQFGHDVSFRIHNCMVDDGVKFIGCVSNDASLYLIFSII